MGNARRFQLNNLKCKLVKLDFNENWVFIPLSHSFDAFKI